MTELKLYKGLTYLLALPNAFMALVTFFGILASLANPILLFGMLLFIGTVLYAIYSFIFLQKGIVNGKKCKLKLKRNLRVTSIFTILFSIMNLTNFITIISNKASIDLMVSKFFEENKSFSQNVITPDLMSKFLLGTVYFMGIYAALLLLHTLMTYKFTKLYADVFVEEKK